MAPDADRLPVSDRSRVSHRGRADGSRGAVRARSSSCNPNSDYHHPEANKPVEAGADPMSSALSGEVTVAVAVVLDRVMEVGRSIQSATNAGYKWLIFRSSVIVNHGTNIFFRPYQHLTCDIGTFSRLLVNCYITSVGSFLS